MNVMNIMVLWVKTGIGITMEYNGDILGFHYQSYGKLWISTNYNLALSEKLCIPQEQ